MSQGQGGGFNLNTILASLFAVVLLALLVLIIVTIVVVVRIVPAQQPSIAQQPPIAQQLSTPAPIVSSPTTAPAISTATPQVNTASPTSEVPEDYTTIDSTIQTLRQRGYIDIGIGKESAPYAFEQTTGASDWDGYEFRLFSEILRRWKNNVNFDVKYHGLDIPFRVTAVISNEVDFTISSLPESDSNCSGKTICTKNAFAKDVLKIMLRNDAKVPDPADPDALCNFFKSPRQIGFLQATAGQRELNNIFSNCILAPSQLKSFPSRRAAIRGVLDGVVGGYITFGHILDYYRESNPKLKVVGFQPRKSEDVAFPQSVVAVFRSNSEGLRDLIDITIAAMVYDGTYKRITDEAIRAGLVVEPSSIKPTAADCNSVVKYWEFVGAPKSDEPPPKCN